jgi:hypothetical protein
MTEPADKNFSPQESLQLIQSMIDKTKDDISKNSFNFLLWGWLIFLAIVGQYLLKVVFLYRHHYIVWLITFVATGISIIYSKKQRRRHVRSYISENMNFLWTGLGISFFVLSFLFWNIAQGWQISYPFFILLYGLGTFVSGRILKFPPLIIGGIINWILAMIAVKFDFDHQMLFAAAALLTSYIIPGHLLSAKNPKYGR